MLRSNNAGGGSVHRRAFGPGGGEVGGKACYKLYIAHCNAQALISPVVPVTEPSKGLKCQ